LVRFVYINVSPFSGKHPSSFVCAVGGNLWGPGGELFWADHVGSPQPWEK